MATATPGLGLAIHNRWPTDAKVGELAEISAIRALADAMCPDHGFMGVSWFTDGCRNFMRVCAGGRTAVLAEEDAVGCRRYLLDLLDRAADEPVFLEVCESPSSGGEGYFAMTCLGGYPQDDATCTCEPGDTNPACRVCR